MCKYLHFQMVIKQKFSNGNLNPKDKQIRYTYSAVIPIKIVTMILSYHLAN